MHINAGMLTLQRMTVCVTGVWYCVVLTEAAKIVFEICLAIEFLHSHDIAHRDLKVFLF